MKRLSFYFSLLLIFLTIIVNNNNGLVESQILKMAFMLSGKVNDLGYNYMFNLARIKVESEVKADLSSFYTDLEHSPEDCEIAIDDAIAKGHNFIIITSGINAQMGIIKARQYSHLPVFWLIKQNARPIPELPKVAIFIFNGDMAQFVLGYFSGLMSKTGVIGFVSHGTGSHGAINTYYLGAKFANPSIKFLNAYTGSWLNPELAYATSKMLIEKGADFLGMSQDDMSVQEALMDAGCLALGITGFPNSKLYGGDIGVGYITNWDGIILKHAQDIINGVFSGGIYTTSFADKGSLSLDTYSYRVPDYVKANIEKLIYKDNTEFSTPWFCDEQFNQFNITVKPGNCITPEQFRALPLLPGNNISKVENYGFYTIPIEFVDSYPDSMKLGITIVSAICIFACIVSMILVVKYRHAKIIRSASPAFCLLILFGCIIIFIGCIIFTQSPSDETCRTRVWLLSIGYTVFLGSLLVKNWRIWLLFDNPKLKKRALTNWKLYPWVAGILLVDLIILGIWQGIGGIYADRRVGIEELTEHQYTNVCSSNDRGSIALYIILAYHGLTLVIACFISFKIKVVDIEEFNESKPITTSVYIITFCLFIVIPLMVSPQSVSSQSTIICVCSIVTTMISIILLFGSKFYKMATLGVDMNQTFASTRSSHFSASLDKQKKSSKTSKSGMEQFDDSDESDEKTEEQQPKPFVQVPQDSVLATFTSSDDCTSEIDENIKEIEEQELEEQQVENVSEVKARRLTSGLSGETDVHSNDV